MNVTINEIYLGHSFKGATLSVMVIIKPSIEICLLSEYIFCHNVYFILHSTTHTHNVVEKNEDVSHHLGDIQNFQQATMESSGLSFQLRILQSWQTFRFYWAWVTQSSAHFSLSPFLILELLSILWKCSLTRKFGLRLRGQFSAHLNAEHRLSSECWSWKAAYILHIYRKYH